MGEIWVAGKQKKGRQACTYWARRGRERGPPSRNPQRSARCWTWWRLQRRQHSDQTPAWTAQRESTPGVDQTLETERRRRQRKLSQTENKRFRCVVGWKRWFQSFRLSGLPGLRRISRSVGQVRAEASLAGTFLYIVSIVTDPKHNAWTFFPTRQAQAADVTTMNWVDNNGI